MRLQYHKANHCILISQTSSVIMLVWSQNLNKSTSLGVAKVFLGRIFIADSQMTPVFFFFFYGGVLVTQIPIIYSPLHVNVAQRLF